MTTKQITLPITGMTCASCVGHVEGGLKELDGVTQAVVNLALNTAKVEYVPSVRRGSGGGATSGGEGEHNTPAARREMATAPAE